MASAAQVLRQLQGGWLECLDAQGIYYYNELTLQTSEAAPAAAFGPTPVAQAPVQASAAVTKMQIGVWTVAEDAQGEFYYNQQTGQSFDHPPQEILAFLQDRRTPASTVVAASPTSTYQVQYAAQPTYQTQQYAVQPVYQVAAATVAAQPGLAPVYKYASTYSAAMPAYAGYTQAAWSQPRYLGV
eukprot:CAMPEP_0204588046 /NCGR_PEP_ID=MMETSP0661-20131031/48398_1 /ASSEMBLY_ACC=CAM_ASM_000606 /TAXON_ID=109239 /ORGANISM="Alexandrium margalefi, Strain AMGDE01CS-322" /LENGTH=184 /DNA_ID=CAMNT_0051597823 /DNA_START=62 /DNA_END=616 /DNA_ORIENTATION=-